MSSPTSKDVAVTVRYSAVDLRRIERYGEDLRGYLRSEEPMVPRGLLNNILGMLERPIGDGPTVETTEILRLRDANAQLLAELHHHFGCDPECEKRHGEKTSDGSIWIEVREGMTLGQIGRLIDAEFEKRRAVKTGENLQAPDSEGAGGSVLSRATECRGSSEKTPVFTNNMVDRIDADAEELGRRMVPGSTEKAPADEGLSRPSIAANYQADPGRPVKPHRSGGGSRPPYHPARPWTHCDHGDDPAKCAVCAPKASEKS